MGRLLSTREAAKLLGVHHSTLSRAVKRGLLRPQAVTPGGFMRFAEEDVLRFQAGLRQPPGGGSPNLYQEAQQQVQAWRHLAEISQEVTASLEPRQVLTTVVERARVLLSAEAAFIALLAPDGHSLRVSASSGLHTPAMQNLRLRVDQGLAAAVLAARGPVVVEDYAADTRLHTPPLGPVLEEGLVAHIAVPFSARGHTLGILYVANRHVTRFTQGQAELLQALAGVAALAVEHGRVFERERELHHQSEARRRRLQTIIESIPEGVFISEAPSGRISLANTAASHLLGLGGAPVASAVPTPFELNLYRPDGIPMPREERPVQRSLHRQEVCAGVEAILECTDGRRIPALVNSAPLFDAAGNVTGVVTVVQDITRLKELEQLKSDFLSMVSHDLRTPLASIKAMSSSLAYDQGLDTATRQEFLQAMDEEADRLTSLVNNLLDMSRLEAGVLKLEPERCHLLDVAQAAVRELELARSGQGHPITLTIPPDLPELYVDFQQVQRVLINLLSNAVKYSPPGTEVEVRASLAPGQREVVVAVRDQGVGIASEDLGRIFEKFYRQRRRDSRGRLGTGLGLAICKAIVELHRGMIWVESTLGGGSTFSFTLPLEANTS
ncbi:MAG: GAF domain-containing protein [Chloroflexi bacterium]|nr:GAF domain-containing protein [Chloroflexota bacterium]